MARKPKQVPTFFKVLLSDFMEKLKIPPAFVKKFKKIMPKAPTLKPNEGKSCEVTIVNEGDSYFFKRGWNTFVKNQEEEIKIKKQGFKRRGSPLPCRFKTPQASARTADKDKVTETIRSLKRKNPYFVAVLKKYQKYNLVMPKDFANKTKLVSKEEIVMKDPKGRSWPVKVNILVVQRGCQVRFGLGWSQFYGANELATGDTCVFHFIAEKGNLIEVEIHKEGVRGVRTGPAKSLSSVKSELI
ncbi:B3 domain-containing protein Os01g0723500 isoform X2 [Jatropha curcas]|uniref:B3 domain-containing protein Os01g0723500 isoform X2 n=1 Tax=Jatropha curcas TaxID=180498 RepID=UPI0005FADD3F|nr:B3 domain-containing protein Os01g0723500 isoform X2 [Jatropha curcas]